MDTFEKVDATTLKKTILETREVTYDYDFLLKQKAQLEASLREVDGLLAQARILGVDSKSKIGEPVLVEPPAPIEEITK